MAKTEDFFTKYANLFPDGFYRKVPLTDLQKASKDSIIKFRGEYLESMVEMEGLMNAMISAFFNAPNNKKIVELFNHFLLPNRSFTLSLKLELVRELIKIENSTNAKVILLCKTLEKYISLRNIVAHYPCNFDVGEGPCFIQPTITYPESKFTPKITTYFLPGEAVREMGEQMNIIGSYILVTGILLGQKINKQSHKEIAEYRQSLIDTFDSELFSKRGVYRLIKETSE